MDKYVVDVDPYPTRWLPIVSEEDATDP